MCESSPSEDLANHKSHEIKISAGNYEQSTLPNGIKVLTEAATHPSNVNLGILLNLGTRDETLETSGSMLSIQNTYMKTVLNTNETVPLSYSFLFSGQLRHGADGRRQLRNGL